MIAGIMTVPLLAEAQDAPTVVSSLPANMAMGVSPATVIVIQFSAAMNTNVTVAQVFSVMAPTTPLVITTTWSADAMTLTCAPKSPLPMNTAIVWNVEGEDRAGHALDGNNGGIFITGEGGPSIVSVVPANLATNVPLNTTVVFTFSAPMNTGSTWTQFRDAAAPLLTLSVTTAWSSDKTQLTCTPKSPLSAGKTILWTVVGEDLGGHALEGGSGMFMTVPGTPMLLSVVPADGTTDVSVSAPVVFSFSKAMDTTATAAQFFDAFAPSILLPTEASWNNDHTQLSCQPKPSFVAGTTILWNIAGQDATGAALTSAQGTFDTAASPGGQADFHGSGLISRGESAEQVDTNLFQIAGPEFIALATANGESDGFVVAPSPGSTNVLANAGAADALEFSDIEADPAAFATNYPAGTFWLGFAAAAGTATAALELSDDVLPSAPRVNPWQDPPHAVLGQPWTLRWDADAVGAPVDYVRLRVEQDGAVIFASPLPDATGALTGASNTVVVPASVFTTTGRAEVSLTAFSFTALETNAIPGVTLHAARHRTTTFELAVVDGSVPPPTLLTTNMGGVAVGEPFLNPLFATNGVRPLHFEVVGGTLPPGLMLESGGAVTGQPESEGSFHATLRLTDLLNHSSTQSLQVVTVPLPPSSGLPEIKNVRPDAGPAVVFDVVGAAVGECVIERSADLSSWTSFLTTNVTVDRLTVRVPVEQNAGFFRVRGPGASLPTPHPLTVAPVLDLSATASANLDELGGSLSLTNGDGYVFTLQVPVGALDRSETITITDVAAIGGLPLSGGLRAAVQLQPEGLVFNNAARLDITAPADVDPATIIGFGARPDGSQFALQPTFNTNRTVSLYLWHFSLAGAGDGTAGDAQAQTQNSPDDSMAALAQQVAAALQACRADPNCDLNSKNAELLKLYIQMADQVVLPKLQKAVADDSLIDDALQTWLKWLKDLSLLGLYDGDLLGNDQSDALGSRVRRAGNLAARALLNAINKACEKCMQHEVFRLYRMLELTRDAALLGLDYDQLFWNCARKCLVFELEVESEITSSDGSVIYATHTKGKAKLRPHSLGSGDADLTRLMLIFEGSGKWDVTDLQHTTPPKCQIVATPAPGRLQFPWVKIDLYKKRQVPVPGQDPVTTYIFDPDMTVMMRAGLEVMPKEGRQMVCPPAPAMAVADIFCEMFNAFHNNEVLIPNGLEAEIVGGPVFKMTGFVPGGPDDVILSKPYFQTLDVTTENTLIQLRHTPGQ